MFIFYPILLARLLLTRVFSFLSLSATAATTLMQIQSNFFAALDDSDNEGKAPAPAVATKKTKAAPAPKPEVVEPSKVVERRP